MNTNFNDQHGFTLIEAIVAMAVLAIGIFALYSMQITSIDSNAKAQYMTNASNWSSDQIEKILSMDYASLVDGDGDGTAQPTSVTDGVVSDADGGDFGLNDQTTGTADGKYESPDEKYTVYWNVAVDQPIEGLKTVRIFTKYKAGNDPKVVMMDYIKAEM